MVQTRVPQKVKSLQTRTARRFLQWPVLTRLALIGSQIHYISESIRCCGAGTAADTEFVTALISSNIELHALSTGRKPRVVTAMTMLKQYLFRFASRMSHVTNVLNPFITDIKVMLELHSSLEASMLPAPIFSLSIRMDPRTSSRMSRWAQVVWLLWLNSKGDGSRT